MDENPFAFDLEMGQQPRGRIDYDDMTVLENETKPRRLKRGDSLARLTKNTRLFRTMSSR